MKTRLSKKNLGAAIKELRIGADMRQIALSNMTKVTQTHISQIENGVVRPSIKMMRRISSALKVPQKEIIRLAIGAKTDGEILENVFEFYNY